MHRKSFFISLFLLITILIPSGSSCQNIESGSSVNNRLAVVEIASGYHLIKTDIELKNITINHDWHYFPPKIGMSLIRKRNSEVVRSMGLTYLAQPNLTMLNWKDKKVDATSTIEDTTTLRARSFELQLKFGAKKYSKTALNGFYVGINGGISFLFYRYQRTQWTRNSDYSLNTITTTESKSHIKRGIIPFMFLSGSIGSTFSLKNNHLLDIGLRTSVFFRLMSNSIQQELITDNDIRTNIAIMGRKAMQSQQTLEIYATYSIFH